MKVNPTSIILLTRGKNQVTVRKLHPDTVHVKFGNIVCKDKHGQIVQTISLARYGAVLDRGNNEHDVRIFK